MKSSSKKILIASLFFLLLILLRISGVGSWLNVGFIKANQAYFTTFLIDHYFLAVFSYIALSVLVVMLSLPLTIILTMASGFFFNALPGALYSIIGNTIGAVLSFLLFRYLLHGFVQQRYGASLKKFNKELQEHGASYLLSLLLMPITPFGVITILSGLSDLPLFTFIWVIAVGTLPSSLLYAFSGKQLIALDPSSTRSPFLYMMALLLLALIALLPLIWRYYEYRKKKLTWAREHDDTKIL